jgi:hypothetical protein
MVNPHHSDISTYDLNKRRIIGPFNPNGNDNVAYIAHYFNKTHQDWVDRIKRGAVDGMNCNKIGDWEKYINDNIQVDNFDLYNFMYGGD